jgi:hypothetical protein
MSDFVPPRIFQDLGFTGILIYPLFVPQMLDIISKELE